MANSLRILLATNRRRFVRAYGFVKSAYKLLASAPAIGTITSRKRTIKLTQKEIQLIARSLRGGGQVTQRGGIEKNLWFSAAAPDSIFEGLLVRFLTNRLIAE